MYCLSSTLHKAFILELNQSTKSILQFLLSLPSLPHTPGHWDLKPTNQVKKRPIACPFLSALLFELWKKSVFFYMYTHYSLCYTSSHSHLIFLIFLPNISFQEEGFTFCMKMSSLAPMKMFMSSGLY